MSAGRTSLRRSQALRYVARREILERLRGKAFYAFTGVLVVVILAIGVIGRVAGDDEPADVTIGLVGPAPDRFAAVAGAIAAALDRDASVQPFDDVTAAQAALDEGDVDVVVVGDDRSAVFADEVDEEVFAIVQQAWAAVSTERALVDAGLDEDAARAALAATALQVTTLEGDDEDTSGIEALVGTLAAVLLFGSLQTFGGYVLTGVVEEKSSAVVEILLVRVRADQLLAGKVIGIGATALLQFSTAVLAGLAALVISGAEVPGEIWGTIPTTFLWFAGGYAFYATLFALAGSLVSRQEDAQAASAPIISVLLASYLAIFIFGYAPDSTVSTVLSLLPPVAPLLMPMRMAAGAASIVEIVASFVLLVAGTFAVWKLASRIFEHVLLRKGSRIAWRDALALLRP